jgi:acyl carrier protein
MKNHEIVNKIDKIFKKTLKINLPNKNISKLKIGDFKEWDSLGNFNLLLEIEKNFKVRFKPKELTSINSIQKIIDYLKKK